MFRILIIEEHEKIQKSLVRAFKQEGLESCEGVIWDQADELLRKNTYDLIVVDFDTEHHDTSILMNQLKVTNSMAEIIVLTSQSRFSHDQKYDAYDCILKPFKLCDVVNKGKKALEKKQLVDKVRSLEKIIGSKKFAFL
ncbi:MAG: response regulator [Candidatus Brocadiaceae bacterium]